MSASGAVHSNDVACTCCSTWAGSRSHSDSRRIQDVATTGISVSNDSCSSPEDVVTTAIRVSSDSCSSLGDVATTSIRVSRVTQTAVVNLQVDRCRRTPCVLAFLALLQRFYPHDAKRDIFYVLCQSIRLSQAGSYCTETA